jgi:glycosyltransferase involved in cell wall biosynthesis
MRIAILAWESLHSVAVGGLAAHTSELAAALAARGHQVHLFTRRMPGQLAHDCIDNVHYHRCLYIPQGEFVDDINSMCRAFVDKVFEIEDFVGRFDVVHAHDWLCANALIWIKQGRGHKTVLTIHSTEYARCGNTFVNGRSTRVREQERAGTYWADKVIAVSQATKNELLWMYEVPDSKVQVIGNGVDWRRFDIESDPGAVKTQYSIPPMDPTVFFCGRLVWQKGPDILIEAIPAILRSCSNAKFVFAGDGDMRGGLQNRAHNLGIAPAVRFVGYKNGEDLVRLFKSSDTVCVPSRNEPFGIVVLEGWAAGKPVVVTENGGPNEYIRHETNGLKIYPRPDSVSWGINRIFSNFDWARQLGSNGRRCLEQQYGWDKVAEKVLGVYKEVAPEAFPQPQPVSSELYAPRAAALAQRRHRGAVKLEAKVLIPASARDDRTSEAIEVLNETLAQGRCAFQQKEHYLKIRGDWEEVTIALSEFHKKIARVGKTIEWSAGFLRD